MRARKKLAAGQQINRDYFRTIMFGCEDALVSTTGVVVGMSVGTADRSVVVLAGLVTVIVEAFSMAAGEYLSEKAVHQIDRAYPKRHRDNLIIDGVIMFTSYLVAGLVPILPIMVFGFPLSAALSAGTALIGLFALGYGKGKIVGLSATRSGIEILTVGGIATLAGMIVGLGLRL